MNLISKDPCVCFELSRISGQQLTVKKMCHKVKRTAAGYKFNMARLVQVTEVIEEDKIELFLCHLKITSTQIY